MRTLHTLRAITGTARKEKYLGRPHLVVPVVALVEGVVHAMNSETPELVRAEEFSRAPMVWNGKPVFVGHPMKSGRPVSGNTPDILEEKCVGIIFNTAIKKNKLTMEAWIDVEKCKLVDPALLQRVQDDEPIEISVGVFVETDDSVGEYEGTPYEGEWHDLGPDHLALLPEGSTGACSREMGCGVRAAQKGEGTMYREWLEAGPETDALLKTLRNIPQSERDKMPAGDFAGPNKSFPIAEPGDVANAARAIGRAKGDPAVIKTKIIAIAYRKGADFVAQLPDAWKKTKDQKNASMFTRFMGMFRASLSTTESDRDQRQALLDALRSMEPAVYDIVAVYSDRIVYPVYENGCSTLYQRAYTGDEAAGYTVDGNRVEVEPVMTYEPVVASAEELEAELKDAAGKTISSANMKKVQAMHDSAHSMHEQSVALGATCDTPKTMGAHSCGCKKAATEETTVMERTDRIKALRTAHKPFTDEDQKILDKLEDKHLAALELIVKANAPETLTLVYEGMKSQLATAEAAAKAAADAADKDKDKGKVKDEPAAASKKEEPVKFEDVLATADQATKDMINEGLRVGKARRAESIKALKDSKRCDISDEKLNAMSQSDLDALLKLAEVKPPVDFGGQGTSRVTEGKKVAPAPDLNERIRANRAAQAGAKK